MHVHRVQRSIALLMLALFLGLVLFMLVGLSPSRNDPFHSPYIDNQMHSIDANTDTWFHFDYGFVGPPRTVVTLAIANGAQSGLGFEVWAPEIIAEWWKEKPTGQGMVLAVDCSTNTIAGGGDCLSKDLMWIGAFGSVGTYYVHVINRNPTPGQFLLTVQGTSVSPAPVQALQPTVTRTVARVVRAAPSTPTVAALATPYDDPYHAAWLDGQMHSLPGNSATWYKFDYGTAGNFQFRPQVGVRLVGAAGTGMQFEVWSADRLNEWWTKKPVGRGTLEVSYSCSNETVFTATPVPTDQATATATPTATPTGTPAPEATGKPPPADCTHTPTSNLTWFGALGGPGTVYIRVVNPTPYTMNYQLQFM